MRARHLLAALAVALFAGLAAGPASAFVWHEDVVTEAVTASAQTATHAGNIWWQAPTDGPAVSTGAITLSALAVTVLVSLLLPIVTGLVTKLDAPGIVKGLVALAVSAINGLVMGSLAVDGSATIAKTAIVLAGVSWAIQTATYLGVYKPIDAGQKLAPSVGLGSSWS